MKDELFNDLLRSVEEAGAIRKGNESACRVSVLEGEVLAEIRENGSTVWSLEQAGEELRRSSTRNGPARPC